MKNVKFCKVVNVKNLNILTTVIFAGSMAYADLTKLNDAAQSNFRRDNAVLLYEFQGDSGKVVRDTSRIGAPLNLNILNEFENQVIQQPDHLEVKSASLIKSAVPATKLYDKCTQDNKGLSIEVWFENNESQKERTGEFPLNTIQPSRIVSYGEDILKNNFAIGQFYDAGDFLGAAVNTSGRENTDTPGASLSNLLRTDAGETILHNRETSAPAQQMIFTITPDAVARVYLSDRNGNLSRRQLTSTGFAVAGNNIFSKWYRNAAFSLANLPTTVETVRGDQSDYTACAGNGPLAASCGYNSRYWKGKIRLVAVYCKALTDQEILGSKAEQGVVVNPLTIDVNIQITPELLRAQRIYTKISGVRAPIFTPALKEMATILKDEANPIKAAEIATRDPNFLNVTVRDIAAPISNRAQNKDVPMNDFIATFMGIVSDELDSRKMLYENIVYEANSAVVAVPASEVADKLRSNTHYTSLESQRIDLSKNPKRDPANFPNEEPILIRKKQRAFNGMAAVDVPDSEAAGLLTSRTYLQEQCIAGTNRRCVEKIFEHFLCLPLDRVSDSSGPDNVVGKDIDRYPAGSFTKFTTTCKACHTILDSMRPAFAHWTFNSTFAMNSTLMLNIVNAANQENNGQGFRGTGANVPGANLIHAKYNQNDMDTSDVTKPFVKPGSYVTSNSWSNNANLGSNAKRLGWNTQTSDWKGGKGVRSLGKAFSETKQFSTCMATRVFNQLCGRDPVIEEASFIDSAVKGFKERNYNLKYLFQRIGSSDECLGRE